MAAIDPSLYRDITLVKGDKEIDIRLACISIDFFESILSPNITAKIQVVNAGGSIKDDKGDNVTLYDGLKLRGGESLYIYIERTAIRIFPFSIFKIHLLLVIFPISLEKMSWSTLL